MIIKTKLIKFYFENKFDINYINDVFDSINDNKKDAIIVSAYIKCSNNNELYNKALQIYDKFDLFHDNIIHLFAINACVYLQNNRHYQISGKIFEDNNIEIEIYNKLTDIYGEI